MSRHHLTTLLWLACVAAALYCGYLYGRLSG